MKVVCITDKWFGVETKEIKESSFWGFFTTTRHENATKRMVGAKKGEVLEVVKTKRDVSNFSDEILLFYWFNEYGFWHDSQGFRPIDETEEQEADKKIEELLTVDRYLMYNLNGKPTYIKVKTSLRDIRV